MKTLEFLKFHKEQVDFEFALSRLTEEFGIRVKSYREFDTYVLNYCQIESPKYHPIPRECRSLVVNSNCEVVSRSFDRFFNYGEGECEVDFASAYAMEKADGSLISLYFNPSTGYWYFRTRGTAFAESQLPSGRQFSNAILECIGMDFFELQDRMARGINTDQTFIFEFISPENRIVTRYETPQLVLLAVRNNNGIYPPYNNRSLLKFAAEHLNETFGFKNVRACQMFPISSVEEVETAVSKLENLEEGFVVLDDKYNRVKIKSPAYVKCHHIRGEGLTPNRIAELIAINEQEEYLAVFPEDLQFFEPYMHAKEVLLSAMNTVLRGIGNPESQKEFALMAMKFRFSSLLFTCRKKCITIEHAWNEANESYKVELLQWQLNLLQKLNQ